MRLPIIALLFLLGFVPYASHAEVVSSADVTVDATAANATEAKEKALAEGEMAAFRQVVEKMLPDKAEQIIKNTPTTRVSAIIKSKSMLDEKMSDNRYRANIRYNFDPNALSRVLGLATEAAPDGTAPMPNQAAVQPPLMREDAMVILPVWNDNNIMRLWDNENIWRLIWNGVILQHGEGVLVAPFGDRYDLEFTDAQRALRADYALMEPLGKKYGARQVGIMLATVNPDDPKQSLRVNLKILNPDGTGESQNYSYPLRPAETLNQQMQRAALDIALKMKRDRSGESGALDEQINTLTVRMQGVTMKQWETIRAKLLKVPAMQKVELVKVSYFDTTMTLTYRGTPELLGKMLAAAGFRLFKDGDTLVLALP